MDKIQNLNIRISDMLSFMDLNGATGFDDSKIEELESIIMDCNSTVSYGNRVADSIYDTMYSMLKELKPNSKVLSEVWADELDGEQPYRELLESHPMMSIETAKSYDCNELIHWIDSMPGVSDYFASFKINGHGIRVVYIDGELVSATSRMRSSKGRDLTKQLRWLLGERNEKLAEFGQVEIRGELCLRLDNLEKAREFNPSIKSAFSAVSSLVRPSTTREEVDLLDFLAYYFIVDDFEFMEREEEFQQLEEVGFQTPWHLYIEGVLKEDLLPTIKSVIESFEEEYEEFGFFCDGVVFELSNRHLFKDMGISGNHNCANIALKVGLWEQDMYAGYIQTLIWSKGKSKLNPIAVVSTNPDDAIFNEEGEIVNWDDVGVITAQGNKVARVYLYEPRNILVMDAYVGNIIHFRYGGEAGVIPCLPDGRNLSEDLVKSILQGEGIFGRDEGVDIK